jgi:RNA polymerase sigma-70 factor (ECF subfamily)
MVSISDESVADLIGRARDGEATALEKLLEIYRSYISLLARLQINRRLQGRVAASDLVQETILQAGRHFAGFRGCSEGELVVWLRRVLASQVARLYRHHSAQLRDFRLEQQLGSELDQSSQLLQQALVRSQSSPSRSVAQREEAVLLADALEGLPKDYREVILLRNLEGLSFEVVAERMERTVHSVKNLWTRALSKLQDSMCDD